MKKLSSIFLAFLVLVGSVGVNAREFKIQSGNNNFSMAIEDSQREVFVERLSSVCIDEILVISNLEMVYDVDSEGNQIVKGVKLNEQNQKSVMANAMVILTKILEIGSGIPMNPEFMTNFITAFGLNIVTFVAEILNFLGLLFK